MTTTDGSVYLFNSLSAYTDAMAGELLAAYSPDGAIERVTATDPNAENQIAEIQWYASAADCSAANPYQTEAFSYDTTTGDANFGRLTSITLQGYDPAIEELVNSSMASIPTTMGQ